MKDEPSVSDCFEQIAAYDSGRTLHEELNHLPEKYRAPLVLCYLEGKTREQAAEELGCTTGTVKGRLERGRHELRLRLLRRGIGVTLPAVAGGAVISTSTADVASSLGLAPPAVPETLVSSTVEEATTFATAGSVGTAVTSQALTLAKGELAMMSSTPILKSATAAAVALMLISVSYLLLSGDASAQNVEEVPVINTKLAAEPLGAQAPVVPVAAQEPPNGPEPGESDIYTVKTQSMFLVHSRKSKVISVFSMHTGRWHKQSFQPSPGEKVEPILANEIVAFQAGNRVYGFSGLKGTWHSFEVPEGVRAKIAVNLKNWAQAQIGDTWYAFSAAAPEPKWIHAEVGEPSGKQSQRDTNQAAADRKRILGRWKVTKLCLNGKQRDPDSVATVAPMFFTEEGFMYIDYPVYPDREVTLHKYTYRLNPEADPKQIDLQRVDAQGTQPDDYDDYDLQRMDAQRIQPGIYKFENGRLVICTNSSGVANGQRPTKFGCEKDQPHNLLVVHERPKPQADDKPEKKAAAAPADRSTEQPNEPQGSGSFERVNLESGDIADVTGLNIYKYRIDMPKDQRFWLILRELRDPDTAAKVLFRHAFVKYQEGPLELRVSFLRRDRKLQSVLLSREKEADFRIDCEGGSPGGFATIVPVPLNDLEPTRKALKVHRSADENQSRGLQTTRLITITGLKQGRPAPPTSFPRAELVIEPDG